MTEIFLHIVNMSISASYAILAVLLFRWLLKKAPKQIAIILWGIVALRLVCPFSIESVLSLIPSTEVISPDIMTDKTPAVNTGIPPLNNAINPIIGEVFAPALGDSINPLQIWLPILATVWAVGVVLMLLYLAVAYLSIRRRVETAVRLRDNVYQSERGTSPFVLGLIRPRIYLPFGMSERDIELVLAHESAHIRRCDHLTRLLGFLLLSLYWFSPLVWLGYILFCRDIELACDERVIKRLDRDARADYCEVLLSQSKSPRTITVCPLAFGEVGVKARMKSVLHYKKPTLWIIVAAILACSALLLFLLTDPLEKNPLEPKIRYVENDPERLASLEERHPEYFGLDTSKGLDVYVCEFGPEIYDFVAVPCSDEPLKMTDFFDYECVQGIENMRSILSTYEIEEANVHVIAFQHPNSSHISSVYIILEGETEEDVLQRAQEYVAAIRKQLLYQ